MLNQVRTCENEEAQPPIRLEKEIMLFDFKGKK